MEIGIGMEVGIGIGIGMWMGMEWRWEGNGDGMGTGLEVEAGTGMEMGWIQGAEEWELSFFRTQPAMPCRFTPGSSLVPLFLLGVFGWAPFKL